MVKKEDDEPSRLNCDIYYIWQKESKILKVKLDKELQPEISFAIYPLKFEKPLNKSCKNHSLVKKDPNYKSKSHHKLNCHYCAKKCHTIEKCKFMSILVPKMQSYFHSLQRIQ